MNNFITKTIKEIALENPVTIRLFQEYRIDFRCGGKHLFDNACRVAGVEPEIVSEKLAKRYFERCKIFVYLLSFQTLRIFPLI